MRHVGIVDLGSNTARMVVYAFDPGRTFRLVDQIREPIRLGEGLVRSGRLTEGAVGRGVAALRLFADFAKAASLETCDVIGTSALRDADNGGELLEPAEALGLAVSVLDGEQEARLAVTAVANGFVEEDAWVMDLGGGSAQIARMSGRQYEGGETFPLGAVRLTEGHLPSNPPTPGEIESLEAEVARRLGKAAKRLRKDSAPLIAMGGTVRNLARAAQKRSGYPLNLIHGYFLPRGELEELVDRLVAKELSRGSRVPGIHPDRADVIVAGALVFRWLLRASNRDGLFISGDGVREGAFFRHFLAPPHRVADVRAFSVRNLAERYDSAPDHAAHVGFLARRLFDELAPLHGLGREERALLEAGAALHDVGVSVRYYRHHKHGAYLLQAWPLAGFTHREQALLILLVRFHHKGWPALGPLGALTRPGDEKRLEILSTCLRLAEYLERSRAARVRDIAVKIKKKRVLLRLLAREEPSVEMWEAGKHADLFARAFGLRLELEAVIEKG